MKRLGKILLIAAIVVVVILAAGSWALNRWVQSPEAHARIESEIGRAMRMPVKLGKLSFSAWSGLTAGGISVPAGDGNFFEAQSLSAEHKFSSLLRGRIILGDVRIVQPRVRLIEGPDGRWRLPELPATAPVVPAPGNVAPLAPATEPARPKKRIDVLIGKIAIADGSAEFIDRQRLPVGTVKGLNATFRDVGEKSSSGEFTIASIIVPGYIAVEQVKGNTEQRDRTFSVRNLAANVCNGRVAGEFTCAAGAPTSAHLTLEDVDIGLAGKEARARMRNASGVVSGDLQLAGFEGGTKTMTGNGTFLLKSGRCTEIELVRQIGEVLQYAALAGFEVREARTNFRIASERIFLTPLDVSLHPLGMSVSGGIAFDGAVDLAGTLSAPAHIVAKTGLVSAQFSPPDATGRQSVQFDITGTLDKPKQNLAERLTGTKDRKWQRIIAAESILSTLLGRKADKPKPENPKTSAPAPPAQPRP